MEKDGFKCPAQPDLGDLTGALHVLAEKIDHLIKLHRDIIRWLLVVVCVIALGRSAIDVGEKLVNQAVAEINLEEEK